MKRMAFIMLLMVLVSCGKEPPVSLDRIKATYAEGDLRGIKMDDPRWKNAFETPITLEKQLIALPKSEDDGVTEIKIKALYNESWAAFLLRWDDPTPDHLAQIGKYSDSVAIQFPGAPGELPDSAMGGAPGSARPVVIHQWKAVWQEAEAGKIEGIRTFYPNTWSDVYIFEMAQDDAAKTAMERTFTTSVAAGNPLAHHGTAIRDLESVGFGSVEFSAEQSSTGYGQWENGQWRVLIVRSVERNRGSVDLGRLFYAAFAVWDGSRREVGARKMQSTWFPIQFIQRPADAGAHEIHMPLGQP